MAWSLVHRGPDGEGIEKPCPWVGLAHRRLSIIDLEGGRQPIPNEDRTCWVIVNGEIFNYRELRRELIEKGHRFSTQSDSEVILHLYEEEGRDSVRRLNGQFAFAIWDGEKLYCARDAVGIKPFYFYQDEHRFAFASEPRALMAIPGIDDSIDADGLRLFFRYRYIPAPYSAWKRIRKLRAGESLLLRADGSTEFQRFWDLAENTVENLSDLEDATGRVRSKLEEAVERQMVADVPVGAFLSGGLDSSAIVSLMSGFTHEKISTFAIGFPPPGNDERPYARSVAEKVGTNHHDHLFGMEEARTVIPLLLDHLDEPFGDASLIPTYAVSHLARQIGKVALSGDGGDELFAGYGRTFRALHLLSVPPPMRPLYHLLRRLIPETRNPEDWKYNDSGLDRLFLSFLTRTSNRERKRLYGPRFGDEPSTLDDPVAGEFKRFAHFPPLSRLLAVDLHTLLGEYHLVKVDRASMCTSLEVRVPFLDTDFIQLAFQLDPLTRLHGNQSKGLLRRAMRDRLPESVIDRGKSGFGLPLKFWFAGEMADVARERLRDARSVRDGWLNAEAIEQAFRPSHSGKVKGSFLWRLLVFESWYRNLKEGRLQTPRDPAASRSGA